MATPRGVAPTIDQELVGLHAEAPKAHSTDGAGRTAVLDHRSLIRHPRFVGHDHCQRPLVSAFVEPVTDDASLVERERRSQGTAVRGRQFAGCRSLRSRALDDRDQGRIEAKRRHA